MENHKIKINNFKKNNSLEDIASKIDVLFRYAQSLFLESEEILISLSQFKYKIKNFSKKQSITIHPEMKSMPPYLQC